ncbi:hypothetical protein [Ktedonobacter racemifer]|nr:hypothetical protein [Ktedonobacter racemifer]
MASVGLARTEQEMSADREVALQKAAAGQLVAVIAQTYPLERAADAHAAH